jgi:hypothetical protein
MYFLFYCILWRCGVTPKLQKCAHSTGEVRRFEFHTISPGALALFSLFDAFDDVVITLSGVWMMNSGIDQIFTQFFPVHLLFLRSLVYLMTS